MFMLQTPNCFPVWTWRIWVCLWVMWPLRTFLYTWQRDHLFKLGPWNPSEIFLTNGLQGKDIPLFPNKVQIAVLVTSSQTQTGPQHPGIPWNHFIYLFGQTKHAQFNLFIFIYFWLCWVFVSVRGLSPVVASGGRSSSRCTGFSLSRLLLLRSTGSRRAGSVVVAHGPSCSAACGIFPDQGSNPCALH